MKLNNYRDILKRSDDQTLALFLPYANQVKGERIRRNEHSLQFRLLMASRKAHKQLGSHPKTIPNLTRKMGHCFPRGKAWMRVAVLTRGAEF